MKKFSKVLASLLTVVMMLTGVTSVIADETYTSITGEDTTFIKYLITNVGQVVPNVTFKYEIKPADGVVADDGIMEILPGVMDDGEGGTKVSVTDAEFPNGTPSSEVDDVDKPNITLAAGKVYSKREVTVSLSNAVFSEPGVYRYIITEHEVEQDIEALEYDTQAEEPGSMVRVLDVYVVDNGNKELEIGSIVLHETETVIATTSDNGSIDEKAERVETKWAISDEITDDGSTYPKYDTREEAEAALANKRSDREQGHYDQDILDTQEAIDAQEVVVQDAQDALDAQKPNDYDDVVSAIANLEAQIATLEGEYDELMQELIDATDPAEITRIRALVDAKKEEIVNAQAALSIDQGKKETYDTDLAPYIQALKDAQNELTRLQELLAELQRKHNDATVEVVEVIYILSDKSAGYVNEISTYNLEFGKEVTGNQGSKDKYFKFTVKVENLRKKHYRLAKDDETDIADAADGTDAFCDKDGHAFAPGTLVIEIEPSTISLEGNWEKNPTKTAATIYEAPEMVTANNVTQLKADDSGVIEHVFYLKDGEYVKLVDLPTGARYTVTEVEEDYKKTNGTDKPADTAETDAIQQQIRDVRAEIQAKQTAGEDTTELEAQLAELQAQLEALQSKVHDDPTSGTLNGDSGNVYTGYTNTRDGILPTGVAVAAGAGLVMLGIGAVGMLLFGKRKEDDEDED